MLFGLFSKKKTVKSVVTSTIELKHTNGEIITIVVNGSNDKLVAYVSNRIKMTFNVKERNTCAYTQEELEKVQANMDKIWNDVDKLFKELK